MLPPVPVPIAFDINAIKDKLSFQFRPWQRSFQFWVRAIDIYAGYKVSLSLLYSLLCFVFSSAFAPIAIFLRCLGVSSESQFRQRCAEAGSNVGTAARACCRQDFRLVL